MMRHAAPREQVRALACGLPNKMRERILLVLLKAFADESDAGNRQGIFTLSGYVASVSQWEAFTDEWANVLKQPPKMDYFKRIALKSAKWRKEHGFTKGQVNLKHRQLVEVIKKPYILFSAISTVSCADHAATIGQSVFATEPWLREPYYFCYHEFVARVLWKVADLEIDAERVDFVFDRNDLITDNANQMFRWMRVLPAMDDRIRALMGDALPGDDQVLGPLQAADILAGRVKDHWTKPSSRKLFNSVVDISGTGPSNTTRHLRRKHLQELLRSLETGSRR
jgi:hypothetical protein